MNDDDYWFNDFNDAENDTDNNEKNDILNSELVSDNDRLYFRYFDNLANYKNCQPLIDFSKAYINDKLTTRIVNIHGGEFSGKSLLVKLLNRYVNCTTLKVNQLNKQRLHHFNNRYIIVELNDEPMHEYMDLLKEMTGKEYNLDNGYIYEANYTFIFISRTKLPNYFRQQIHYVELENKFNNSNIEFIVDENPEAFYNFIMY